MIPTFAEVIARERMDEEVVAVECDAKRTVAPGMSGTGAEDAIPAGDIAAKGDCCLF